MNAVERRLVRPLVARTVEFRDARRRLEYAVMLVADVLRSAIAVEVTGLNFGYAGELGAAEAWCALAVVSALDRIHDTFPCGGVTGVVLLAVIIDLALFSPKYALALARALVRRFRLVRV